ncbi:hypothetical protein EWM64_g6483, partial [Hericium alpestre]
MQHQYNLRPVSEISQSPSTHSRSSMTPPHEQSPHLPPLQYPSGSGAPRRPISPSHLPHLDVSSGSVTPRIFPPPPSGHELMRLFPPPPPDQYSSALKPGNTSVYFHRQEHAFFAQAGKEIVRVRVEADFMRTDK